MPDTVSAQGMATAGSSPDPNAPQSFQYGVDPTLDTMGSNLVQYGAVAPSANYLKELPYGGLGQNFTAEQQAAAQDVLSRSMTGGEGDQGIRNQLRNQLQKQMGNFQNNQSTQGGAYNAQMQNQLNNALATARRQMGGTGLSGSQQAGANLGNIVGASQAAQSQGLINLQNQGIQQLGMMGQNEGNILGQSLQERGYNLKQGQDLANLLEQNAQMQQQSFLGTQKTPGPSDFQTGLGDVLAGAGTVAAFM